MGLGVYERALVTDGHVCAAGARQWMVGWNVTMMVGSHFHCCSVGGDYRRSAIAVEAMDMRSAVEGGVKSGRRQAGRGLRVVKSGGEAVGLGAAVLQTWSLLAVLGCYSRGAAVVVGCSTQRLHRCFTHKRATGCDGVVGERGLVKVGARVGDWRFGAHRDWLIKGGGDLT